MPPAFAYDAVPYDDYPVTESHVDGLFLAARRAGLPVAEPQSARILELGCAHAVNLIPMAFHLEGAACLGVDLSPVQIDRAQVHARQLGLSNLELRCADVMELSLGERRFDYVIAHGLYSWVPEPVRARVLALCRECLAEGGVAYVSYNAMPAWGIRGAIARALQEGVGSTSDPAEQVRRAREVLAQLEQVQPLRGTAEGALMQQEVEGLRDKPDAYLLHEYLVPCSRAFYLREFVDRAGAAGLSWIGDVASSVLSPAERQRTRGALASLSEDPLVVEQLTDIVGFRQFRASLLCRDDAPRGEPPTRAASMQRCALAAPPETSTFEDPEPMRALLDLLGTRWPADLSLEALAERASCSTDAVAERLGSAVDDGRVQLRPRSLEIVTDVSERPEVTALTRFEARHRSFVTTPLHEHAPLDAFHAALVSHLEGQRDPPGLVEALCDDIEAGRLLLASESAPGREQLRSALAVLVSEGLRGLARAGLLIG